MDRKTRPREHIIADSSVSHFERLAQNCGYSVERTAHDYGFDLLMFTFNANGEMENEAVKIQMKATDNLKLLQGGKTVSFSVECSDLRLWNDELMPVVLVVYDAQQEIAYWVHIQEYFDYKVFEAGTRKTLNIRISKDNVLDEAAIRLFAQRKNEPHKRLLAALRKG